MGIAINPPRTPLLLSDGNLRPEWWKFFLWIQQMVGGPTNPFDDAALLSGGSVSGRSAPGQDFDDLLVPNIGQFIHGFVADIDETIDDRVGALLVAGANVTLTYDDAAGTLTIASTGGAGAFAYATSAVSYAETATSGEKIVTITASGQTVTLPTAVGNTAKLTFKLMVAGTLTIDGAGAETIDGALTAGLVSQYEALTLVSDNANWIVI